MAIERLGLALLCLVASVLPGGARALEPARLVADFPRGQMVLETGGPRCLLVDVYLATTPEQRSQGLMFVESMDEFEGMYFGYRDPSGIVMWMKNTPLPLDMIFIGEDFRVTRVEAQTTPYSLTRIESGAPVVGVLEVGGGLAARWGVKPGTRILGFARDAAPQH
jgi:hypothetical protein